MPYFTEHGHLGGLILLSLVFLVAALTTVVLLHPYVALVVYGVGFTIGALADYGSSRVRLLNIFGDYMATDNEDSYQYWHEGVAAQWFIDHWYYVVTVPYIIHVKVDKIFHRRKPDGKLDYKLWIFGEVLHLAFNFLLTLVLVKVYERLVQ